MKLVCALFSIVLGLLLVIGLHELGHALAAKFCGVNIQRISIGFGRPLWIWKSRNGMEWSIATWPLGGFVRLQNSRIEPVPINKCSQSFDKKPVWMRVIILIGGVAANIMVAFLALSLMFHIGYEQVTPMIKEVLPQSLAQKANIRAPARVVQVGDVHNPSWEEISQAILMHIGHKTLRLVMQDAQGTYKATLNLTHWRTPRSQTSLLVSVGIVPDMSVAHQYFVSGVGLSDACQKAVNKIQELLVFLVMMLKQIITGTVPFVLLMGPLGLFELMVHSFLQGVAVFLYFIAHLSLAVALVNMLPIPGLDGGSIVYALIEKISGKPISIALEVLLYRLALIVFGLLLVQLILNDVLHLWFSMS